MTEITLELEPHLANKWKALVGMYKDENQLMDALFAYYQEKLKQRISRLQLDLDKYEQQYQMSSADFYQQFKSGKTDDSEDFMLWAGIYEFQLDSKQQLEQLT